ncbi:UNKNOWN [Stylonychia lemnae]|uniref:TRP C-terminal domain-containing protein n=1 Tax=Stylonychia lemnae TaxID=5949 RepID=A0A078ABZ0_STYLE|nr:UNKNOWN [Stylonychia lemnae]|eukprot:CDW78293.1 UNKNOWN [Stylonychia lemnae]
MDYFNGYRELATSCPATTYPIILGGTNANTAFTDLDTDPSGNIGIGGYTYDSGLLGIPQNNMQPIIAMISPGSTYLWSKTINLVGYMTSNGYYMLLSFQPGTVNADSSYYNGIQGVAISGDTSSDEFNSGTVTLASDYSINLPSEVVETTQIRGINSQSLELLYQDASWLGLKLMSINFQTLVCTVQTITIFASNTNMIYSSKYLTTQGGYHFVGGFYDFGGGPTGVADQTFNQQIGAILPFLSSHRCLGSQEQTEVIAPTITIDLNLASIQGMTYTTSSYQFSYSTLTLSTIASNTVSLTTCGALNAYTFSPKTTQTGIYMIGSSQTFTMALYTIDCNLATLTQQISFDAQLSDSVFATSTVYTIDNINSQIILNTADAIYDGYTIVFKLSASVEQTWQTAQYNYEILFQQYACDKVAITTYTVPDVTYFLSYGDGYIIADINWPQTQEASCPYSSEIVVTNIQDGLTYQTIRKIDISNPTHFQIQSLGLTLIGNYRVSRNLYTSSFYVQVTEECKVNQIYAVDETYYIFTVVQSYSDLPFYSYLNLKDIKLPNQIQTKIYLFKNQNLALQFFQKFELSIKIGEATEFTQFENFVLNFYPTEKHQLKSYEIQYSVASLMEKQSYTGTFKVDVGIYIRTNQTDKSIEKINGGQEGTILNSKLKRIITAKIISMSFRSVATIRFNDTLALDHQISNIDFQKFLKIEIRDGLSELVDYQFQNVTNFYGISYDGIDLKLQLEFSYPESISQQSIFNEDALAYDEYPLIDSKFTFDGIQFTLKCYFVLQTAIMGIFQGPIRLNYKNKSILVNVGYIFIGLILLVLLGLLMFLFKKLSDKYELVIQLLVSVLAYHFNTQKFSDKINIQLSNGYESDDYEMTISGLVLIVMFMMPFATYAFLLINKERLFERSFKKRFGSFYLDLDIIQILFNLIIALGTLAIQINYMPLDTRQGNNFEIFNELQYFTILSLILILVGDIITDIEIRYSLGWAIVIMVINFIILNWGYLFVLMGISIVKYSRIYYRRFLMMRALKRKVKKLFNYHVQNQLESTLVLEKLQKKLEQIPAVDIQVMEFSQSKILHDAEQVDEINFTQEEENDRNEQDMITKTPKKTKQIIRNAQGHVNYKLKSPSPSQLSVSQKNLDNNGAIARNPASPQKIPSLKYKKAKSHRMSNKKLAGPTKNFMKQESLPISDSHFSMQNGIFISQKHQPKSKQFGISLIQNHLQRNNYIDTLGSDEELTGRHNKEEDKMSFQHQQSQFSKASNRSNNISPGILHRQTQIQISSLVNLAPVFRESQDKDEQKTDENRLDELKKRLARYNIEKHSKQ